MSYPSAPPRAHQIDVVDQVSRAYRVAADSLQLALEMALLPYLIVLGIELVAILITGTGYYGLALAGLIHAIAFLVFGSVFIVRWHRFVLLGESVAGGPIPPGWAAFLAAGVKLAVLIFVAGLALMVIAALPPHLLTAPLAALCGFAMTLFSLRVSLIFPAAAVERPIGLRTAWNWVEGNFVRLFTCVFACYLPFIVAQVLVGAIEGLFPSALWFVFEALRLAVVFAAIAVITTLLSHLYRDLARDTASG